MYLGTANLYLDDTVIYCTGENIMIEEVNDKLQKCVDDANADGQL